MKRHRRLNCALCLNTYFKPRQTVHRAGEDWHVVDCTECGHTFVVDPPADTANHADTEKLTWAFRSRHQQIRRLLLKHLMPNNRVIDIGCGRGEIGYLLRGDPFEYVGYEPAQGLSDFGIQRGINILQQEYDGKPANAIILDNVVEHVMEPRLLIRQAARALYPQGILIVITPNRDDIRALSSKWRDRHLWVPPDHINYFSRENLFEIFQGIGLKARHFQFAPLTMSDWKFFPRALAETFHLSLFGHNIYAISKPANWGDSDHPGRLEAA